MNMIIKYLTKEGREQLKNSKEKLQNSLIHFAKHYLITAINIGSQLLIDYSKEKELSPEEWLDQNRRSYETLSDSLKEVATSISNSINNSQVEKNSSSADLDKISMHLFTNEVSSKCFFLLHSLNQSQRFLKKLPKFLPKIGNQVNVFNNEMKYLKEVRDIYEHFDEYLSGNGRNEDKNFVLDENRRSISDATGISGVKDENTGEYDLIIGNRISIKNSVNNAKSILAELIICSNEG